MKAGKLIPFGPVLVKIDTGDFIQTYGVMARASRPRREPTVRGGWDFEVEVDEAWPGGDDSGYNVWSHLSARASEAIESEVAMLVLKSARARPRLDIDAHEEEVNE